MSREYEQMQQQQPRYSDDRFVGSSAFPAAASQPAMLMDYRGGSRGGAADVESLMNVRDFPALLQSRSPPPVPPVYQQERSPYDYRRGATGYEMMEQQHGGYSASPAAAYRQRDEMIPQLKQFGSGGSSAASAAGYNNSYGNSNNNSYGGGGPSRPKRARGMSPQAPPVERFF